MNDVGHDTIVSASRLSAIFPKSPGRLDNAGGGSNECQLCRSAGFPLSSVGLLGVCRTSDCEEIADIPDSHTPREGVPT